MKGAVSLRGKIKENICPNTFWLKMFKVFNLGYISDNIKGEEYEKKIPMILGKQKLLKN